MYENAKSVFAAQLADIERAGLWKHERTITSPQAAHITANGKEVVNFCANNYLGLSSHPRVIAAAVVRVLPDAKFTFRPDTVRQAILDSWPKSLDDSAARRDWGWRHRYDLDTMTDDLVPRVRRMLDLGAILSSH